MGERPDQFWMWWPRDGTTANQMRNTYHRKGLSNEQCRRQPDAMRAGPPMEGVLPPSSWHLPRSSEDGKGAPVPPPPGPVPLWKIQTGLLRQKDSQNARSESTSSAIPPNLRPPVELSDAQKIVSQVQQVPGLPAMTADQQEAAKAHMHMFIQMAQIQNLPSDQRAQALAASPPLAQELVSQIEAVRLNAEKETANRFLGPSVQGLPLQPPPAPPPPPTMHGWEDPTPACVPHFNLDREDDWSMPQAR